MELTRGEKIKKLLEEKNISVPELAENINKTKSYIYQIIRNEVSPSLETLRNIANALDVSVGYLEEENELITRISYQEPAIFDKMPDDMKEFIMDEENNPRIEFAMQLTRDDLEEMLKNVKNSRIQLLIKGLLYSMDKQKNS